MVQAAEVRLGVLPRRRTELLEERIRILTQQIAHRQQWLQTQLARQQDLLAQFERLPEQVVQREAEIAELEATYQAQGRTEKTHSQLAKARRQLQAVQKKLKKAPQTLQQAQRAQATHQRRLEQLQTELAFLTEYLAQLQADNASNVDPVPIILRMDAGFGTDANITWLIEMGYIIYTKAHNAQVAKKLLAQVHADTPFSRVGKNAEMIAFDGQFIHKCPYPLTLALERFYTPAGLKHSALIVYRDDGRKLQLKEWFNFYNGRQLIEAGIKEGNVVFKMHPLKFRSEGGIALQEQFALFAANFVRFAAVWLRNRVKSSYRRFDDALSRVKAMVRVVANTSAWVLTEAEAVVVRFDETGAFPGVEISLSGTWRRNPPILPPKKVPFSDFGSDLPLRCT